MADAKKYTKRSASLVALHQDRQVKSYLVFESELEGISMLNGLTTIFAGVGSFLSSLCFGLWSGLFVDSAPSEAAQRYGSALEWVFGIGAAVCFGIAGYAIYRGRSAVALIKAESSNSQDDA